MVCSIPSILCPLSLTRFHIVQRRSHDARHSFVAPIPVASRTPARRQTMHPHRSLQPGNVHSKSGPRKTGDTCHLLKTEEASGPGHWPFIKRKSGPLISSRRSQVQLSVELQSSRMCSIVSGIANDVPSRPRYLPCILSSSVPTKLRGIQNSQ